MTKRIPLVVAVVMLVSAALIALGGPKEDVQDAAKKVSNSANYAWKATVEAGFGAGVTEGKTQKDGLTSLTMERNNATFEMIFKGENGAIKTGEGWQSIQEVLAAPADQQQGPGRFIARMTQGYKPPATLAADLAGKTKSLAKADDAIGGELNEEAAKELLSFRGGRRRGAAAGGGANPVQVSDAKGSVKYWIKDGALSKMQVKVQGIVTFNGQDRDVDRTETVEIKDVGSTKIDVPAEAKEKGKLP
jgi:hypothetical protein